jgi:hypothetical protein
MTHILRVIGQLHESSIEVREDLCAAAEAHVRAEIISVLLAEEALVARQADLQGDAIAYFQCLHVRSEGCDNARRLVTQSHGLANDKITIASMGIVMEIGTTETSCSNGNLDFGAGRSWCLAGFLFFISMGKRI